MNDARDGDFSPYQGRHSASESGAEYTPGPTSPVSGKAGEAAARAAYSGAPKSNPTPEPVEDDTVEVTAEEDVQQEQTLDDSPESLAAAFELQTSAREEELLNEVQLLRAEVYNRQQQFDRYQERVKRDREIDKAGAREDILESLLPVLDEIHLARLHGDLVDGPFAKIAEKLETTLGKYGVERYGAAGEAFDPMIHQAITHTVADLPAGTSETTVIQVMQPGYRMGEKVVRPAFVAVADPR